MDFKERVGNVKNRMKQGASNVAHRTGDKIKASTTDFVKEQFESDVQESKAYQKYQKEKARVHDAIDTHKSFARQKAILDGQKFKSSGQKRLAYAKLYTKAGLNQVGNTDFGRKVKSLIEKIQKTFGIIVDNIKLIAIMSVIIIAGSYITFFSISLIQAAGKSPHYYCEVYPDDFIKDTEFYKQYCERNPDSFKLETLNGHYIVQDGSDLELQKSCAINNMLLRFWWMNDINWYDIIWDETGQYPVEPLVTLKYENGAKDLRHYINGNDTGECKSTCNTSNSRMATAFAAEQGVSGWKTATWGYLRDNSVIIANQATAGEDADNTKNENWVWDLSTKSVWDVPNDSGTVNDSGELKMFALSNWTFRGGDVKIYHLKPGEKWTTDSNQEIAAPKDDLDLLNMILGQHIYKGHPEGIVAYTDDAAILITGWDSKTKSFICIDSSLGIIGGFEGPITKSTYCKNHNNEWNAWLKDIEHSPIKGFYILDASFENKGNVTMGVTDARALDNAYAYPANPDPIKEVVFGAPPSPYAKDAVQYASTAATITNPFTEQGIPYGQGFDEWKNAAKWTPDIPADRYENFKKYNSHYDCIGLCRMAYIAASRGKLDHDEFGAGCTTFYNSLPYYPEYVLVPLEEMQAGDIILMQLDDDHYIDHAVMWLGRENLIAEAGGTKSGLKVHEVWGKDKIWAVVRIYPKGEGPV